MYESGAFSLVLVAALSACSGPPIEGTSLGLRKFPPRADAGLDPLSNDPEGRSKSGAAPDGGAGGPQGPGAGPFDQEPGFDGSSEQTQQSQQGQPNGTGQGGGEASLPDTDADGVPDPSDCDPQSSRLGARVIEDDLATAKGVVLAAPGFDPSAWTHGDGGYRQGMLRNQGDASFLQVPATGNFVVDVRAAMTQVGSFAPKLRQEFVIVGGNAAGGAFAAYGCGIEVVEGEAQEWKTSLVRLSGSGSAIIANPIRRADRQPIVVGEEFGINVTATGGSITCTVSQGTGATTVAAIDATFAGTAVGFYTRQAKARFSRVRVCQLAR